MRIGEERLHSWPLVDVEVEQGRRKEEDEVVGSCCCLTGDEE